MDKPWLEKQDDKRTDSSIYRFIIFCEDGVSEPEYFKSFQNEKILVSVIPKQQSKTKNVIKAIVHCKKNNLLNYKDGKYVPTDEDGFQIWCVFDRDKTGDPNLDVEEDTHFHASIKSAQEHSINVAWSNDAFELWIMLHVEDIEGKEQNYRHRDSYYERLVEYFRVQPNPHEELQKKLMHASFDYDDIKQSKVFKPVVLPLLEENRAIAIERAQKLEALHIDKPFHERVPCTMVHHLVLQLIEKGKE